MASLGSHKKLVAVVGIITQVSHTPVMDSFLLIRCSTDVLMQVLGGNYSTQAQEGLLQLLPFLFSPHRGAACQVQISVSGLGRATASTGGTIVN